MKMILKQNQGECEPAAWSVFSEQKLSRALLCFFMLLSNQGELSLTVFAEDAVRRDATVRAVEKVMPSVVNIRTEILWSEGTFTTICYGISLDLTTEDAQLSRRIVLGLVSSSMKPDMS